MRALLRHELACVGGGVDEAGTATAVVSQTIGCIAGGISTALSGGNITAGISTVTTCIGATQTWNGILQGADPAVPIDPELPPAPDLDFSPSISTNDSSFGDGLYADSGGYIWWVDPYSSEVYPA